MPVYSWSSAKKPKCNDSSCLSIEVTSHPLKSEAKISSNNHFVESLQKWSTPFEELDPLLRFEQMNMAEESPLLQLEHNYVNFTKAWSSKRTLILNKYTTGEKLTIVSSYLPGGEKTLIRQVSNLNEKVKHRLEQLDDFDETSVRKTMGLSQQEFVTKIHMLDDEIKKAWETEQRVRAFKIAIQCSKLLSDINVMQFYPSKFVLISDILDNFGNLVFDRLKSKSYGTKHIKGIQDIDPKQVPETAKETCQNWMFKMASIRELLPRLYMEMSLLKCYVFISKDEIKPTIVRLTTMIRGIGNPLVAIYLRVYLCNVASKLLRKESEEYFYENLKEFLNEYQQVFHPMLIKKYGAQLLTLDQYLSLYVPAFDWLFYGTLNSSKCKITLLEDFLAKCEEMQNNELFMCCVVSAFDSESVIKKSCEILEMIQKSADKMVMLNHVLTSLGEHLCNANSYRQLPSKSLCQTWWKIANNMKSTADFLQVLEPWLQFICTQLSTQHINFILRGTIRYLVKCRMPVDDYSTQIQAVVKRMLKSVPEVEELFLMDAFMPLVELVQKSGARSAMAQTVLAMFFERYGAAHVDDRIVAASLMRLCQILHDSINAVTVEDETKLCADLINKFVQAVKYYGDPDKQLNFYEECRAAFINLDAVLVTLVYAVNTLSVVEARGGMRRACAAYCHVTVPSLRCALSRAQLYLLGGQTALLNNCIGQAEANLKAFVNVIPDIPHYIKEDGQNKPTHDRVIGLISNFLSTLLILPDNLDTRNSNCKAYILSEFIGTLECISWKKTDSLYYSSLLSTLDVLCHLTQDNYAYHIEGVLSNDELYGAEDEYIQFIENHASNVCQELLVVLKALGDAKELRKQYNLALELFWRIIRRGDLETASMATLAANLWVLSQRLQDSNSKFAISLKMALANDKRNSSRRLLEKIEDCV